MAENILWLMIFKTIFFVLTATFLTFYSFVQMNQGVDISPKEAKLTLLGIFILYYLLAVLFKLSH